MKLGQSVCLDEFLYIFENESFQVKKSQSLGQFIEDPLLVTKGCYLNLCSLMLCHTVQEALVSDPRASWPSCS